MYFNKSRAHLNSEETHNNDSNEEQHKRIHFE